MERVTTMLDDVKPHEEQFPLTKSILRMAPVARRYIFDAEASARVGEMLHDNLDLLIDNIEFARAPYPTTYIEIDFKAYYRAWRREEPSLTSDTKVGFLISGANAIEIVKDDGAFTPQGERPMAGMFGFSINRPQRIPPEVLFRGATNGPYESYRKEDQELSTEFMIKMSYVLGGYRKVSSKGGGYMDLHIPLWGDKWSLPQIAQHFDIWPAYSDTNGKTMVDAAFMGSGDPVLLLACLLLLNQPAEYTTIERTPAGRGIYRGKLKSFKEHNIVSVSLEQRQHIIRRWEHTDRASPLLHDVEGHWKNYNKSSRPCEHNWEPLGTEMTSSGQPKHYWCPRCFQRRTWTEAFVRGDAERGVATKHYEVKK